MFPIKTILVPADFSENSEVAFAFASSLARDYGAKILIYHNFTVPLPDYTRGIPPLPTENPEILEAELRRFYPEEPNLQVAYRVEEGFAPRDIVRFAQEAHADLIVMGTHGRSGVKRLLMGSVAEHVVRKAPCPVLTIKCPHLVAQAQTAVSEPEAIEMV